MAIIQIVPRLSPAIDGVGDYALNLARQLHKDYGITTHFLISDLNWTGAIKIEEFPVDKLTANSPSHLFYWLSSSAPSTVLLHYVGYGYAKRGCPVWLVEGLERWKVRSRNVSLVTMFHEISASGSIWTSSFWLSKIQRNLATRLVRITDHIITSKQFYAQILSQLSQGKHKEIPSIPVFSSIGEPQQVPPLEQRQRQMVIFGGRSNRMRVYQKSSALLNRTCELLGIEKILDIGLSIDLKLSSIKNIPIVKIGQQPAAKVSDILLNSLVGFLDYNPDYLAKSSIFATYCAHGLLPVSAQSSTFSIDGIEAGKHYWYPSEQTAIYKNKAELQAIAHNAYRWYQTHKLSIQAEIFAHYVMSNITK
jgi:hypothetical protein